MKDNKRPEIDAALYAAFQAEAENFIKGDHERLSNMIYSVIKALHAGGMTVFLSAATNEGAKVEMCTGAEGDVGLIGTIAGFQLGKVAQTCGDIEAHALLEAFIYGLHQTAPMIDAQVEELVKTRKKGS